MKQYRNYIFDLYGTLVDIHTDERAMRVWRSMAELFTRYGATDAPAAWRDAYFRTVAEREKALGVRDGEIRIEDVFSDLYARRGVAADAETIRETARCFRERSTTHLRCYAGAAELLDALRAAGRGVFLLSNAQRVFTEPELARFGLVERFDGVMISSDVGYRKPSPRFFDALCKEYSLHAADCLMIGNDPDCDVAGARRAGMDSYYIHSALSPARGERGAVGTAGTQFGMDLTALRRKLLRTGKGDGNGSV